MSINGFGQGLGSQFQPSPGFGATTYLHGPGMSTEYASHTGGFSLTNTSNNMTGSTPQPPNRFTGTPASSGFSQPIFQSQPTAAPTLPSFNISFPTPGAGFNTAGPINSPPQGQSTAALLQAVLTPVMQLFTTMMSMFMQNGSFIGEQFQGDLHYRGDQKQNPEVVTPEKAPHADGVETIEIEEIEIKA